MITVYLRKVNGKGNRLQVLPSYTQQQLLQAIKDTLRDKHKQNVQIEAYFKGSLLDDQSQQLLQEVGIISNSIIHVVEKQLDKQDDQFEFKVLVKLVLHERLLEYEIKSRDTISYLKKVICEDLEIENQDYLTLSYLGKELDNSKTAKELNFPSEVLISGSVSIAVLNLIKRKPYNIEKESVSEDSEGIPNITRQNVSCPKGKVKKSESLNADVNSDNIKSKSVFASVQLNKIDQKVEQSRNESQINQSQQLQEEGEEEVTKPNPSKLNLLKPRLTLESLSKPWPGSQKIIETESIVDDDDEEPLMQCRIELIRTDNKKQYIFDCTKEDTFLDALKLLSELERVDSSRLHIQINFDELSRSGISSRSNKGTGLGSSPLSPQLKKKNSGSLSSKDLLTTYQYRNDGISMSIVDYASRLRKKELSFEYELFIEI